eukprot:2634558-Alexandrium_andersonii.AAC.1
MAPRFWSISFGNWYWSVDGALIEGSVRVAWRCALLGGGSPSFRIRSRLRPHRRCGAGREVRSAAIRLGD